MRTETTTKPKKVVQLPSFLKFLFGGLSGIGATTLTQPIDLIKTRAQLVRESDPSAKVSPARIAKTVFSQDGFLGLYSGYSAAILRQATYTTARMGVYTYLIDYIAGSGKGEASVPFHLKLVCGLTAGAVGALVGTPADLCLVRMMADGRLPPAQRRGYSSVGNALTRIVREEGVLTLWRGCIPTVARAMALNGAQLASYGQAKSFLLTFDAFEDNTFMHFTASLFSGFLATTASLPFDLAKSRIQNQPTLIYRSLWDCWVKVVRAEGFLALWTGFFPMFARLAPHTTLTFLFLEQFRAGYSRYASS